MSTRRPIFKKCPLCGKVWRGRREFLSDRNLVLNGYQWNARKALRGEQTAGLLIFTHRVKHCGTTLALRPEVFRIARQRRTNLSPPSEHLGQKSTLAV